MGKPTGFMEYARKESQAADPLERIKNYEEFHIMLSPEEQCEQGARCMECGVPFCQYGKNIKGMTSGCPLNNLIPEWNDLIFRGNLEQAYYRLHKTSNFPEFTCRVCPALCEKACSCGIYDSPVSIKENEMAIIEYAYENGIAIPHPPKSRTGKKVAVIGSGPAGLAAADQLNRRGHKVTVYEKNDALGGLLRYGIPNMKLEKQYIDRKTDIMAEEGVNFILNVNIGKDVNARTILKEFDAVILSGGAGNPRDINVSGRDADGIYFAVDFLTSTTKALMKETIRKEKTYISARDKDVIVIGGGDTGNDCVATAIRHGAKSILQIEMMPEPPEKRRYENPWPQWPLVKKTDYGQEEAIALYGHDPRIYKTTVKEFKKDESGSISSVVLTSLTEKTDKNTGRKIMVPSEGTDREVPCQMVLIAAGFLGPEKYVADAFKTETDNRSNISAPFGLHSTSVKKVYTAGDMHTGQSLVVKAIRDGRDAAKEVDEYLMGYSNL